LGDFIKLGTGCRAAKYLVMEVMFRRPLFPWPVDCSFSDCLFRPLHTLFKLAILYFGNYAVVLQKLRFSVLSFVLWDCMASYMVVVLLCDVCDYVLE